MQEDAGRRALHQALWHSGAAAFGAGRPRDALAAFGAALHLATEAQRAQHARVLARCNLQLGQHRRALEYLDVAAQADQQPCALTELLRAQALLSVGNATQAAAGA
jgi:tetratricopeptide (TPR) repeat protein